MATIRAIEVSSVHRIQSGQVIVDLCSVVKELVENSLDAGATSIDVRFKNHGLDAIEVQDNGSGIAKDDYESIALKHYTSKLSSYDDLETLNTFGFRGEALSSLCALSNVHITTAREDEAPRGTRLDFESSGKLKGTSVVAAQRGTTVFVQTIFKNIPVRRQELDRNIKREYGKVLALLQAYACISTEVRFSVSNTMGKKKMSAFSTKGNKNTRENIANVYSAKALSSLIPLDLEFEMHSASSLKGPKNDHQVKILGHVSKPVVGEGRPLPDRQMFFVNSRPCVLPQVAKVFNEVYRSYNLSQSPFVFANLLLNTNAYDVNVSPDKRTILLHDQGLMLEAIKTDLARLFEEQQQTVPQSQRVDVKLPSYKPLTISRQPTLNEEEEPAPIRSRGDRDDLMRLGSPTDRPAQANLISQFAGRNARGRNSEEIQLRQPPERQGLIQRFGLGSDGTSGSPEVEEIHAASRSRSPSPYAAVEAPIKEEVEKENANELPTTATVRALVTDAAPDMPSGSEPEPEEEIPSLSTASAKPPPGVVPNAFDRMRPLRTQAQTATITIGDKTFTTTTGGSGPQWPRRNKSRKIKKGKLSSQFANSLRSFAAPGAQLMSQSSDEEDNEDEEGDRKSNMSRPASVEREFSKSEQEQAADEEAQLEEDHGSEELDGKTDSDDDGSENEYIDEETKKKREDARVKKLIQKAEERAARPSQGNIQRVHKLLKGAHKDSTTKLVQTIDVSLSNIEQKLQSLTSSMDSLGQLFSNREATVDESDTVEERLSLTVSKPDFRRMRIVGQFNLGFIIALRPGSDPTDPCLGDELFIIDQHASDEKFNFERLQATTTLQNQRLVEPQTLDLTAIDEEIIADNSAALLQNGFVISMDTEGTAPVGKRCTLISLPTSREVTFDTRDLEELLALLSDTPTTTNTLSSAFTPANRKRTDINSSIPRPSKVRRLLAMRACRSSVMIGRTLTNKQMGKLVQNMGEIDKPWNCPHGRPTMRHLVGLGKWEGWSEGRGIVGIEGDMTGTEVDWEGWLDGDLGSQEGEEDWGYGTWVLGEDEEEGEEQEGGEDRGKEEESLFIEE